MEEVTISVFKAKCLRLLEQVRRTRSPLRITKFGKPIAEVVPPSPEQPKPSWIGSMQEKGEIFGDIVSPVIDESDIEALSS